MMVTLTFIPKDEKSSTTADEVGAVSARPGQLSPSENKTRQSARTKNPAGRRHRGMKLRAFTFFGGDYSTVNQ
jgi:hypothetical protein